MLKHQEINHVVEKMSSWISNVRISNLISYTDINRISEGFVMRLLNTIYDWNLQDLNKSRLNYPGVDLGDIASGIAVQVTSEKSLKKLISSYETLFTNTDNISGKLIGDIFSNRIYFFVITDNWNANFRDSTIDKLSEASHGRYRRDDIIIASQLIKDIVELYDNDYVKFKEVYKLVSKYINELPELPDDQVIIEGFQACFDRPAFITPFYQECDLNDFENAISDTIEAINTGKFRTRDGVLIKDIIPKSEIRNKNLREKVDALVDDLITLRRDYLDLLNSGEIERCGCGNPECGVYSMSAKACEKMDSSRIIMLKRYAKLCPGFHARFLDRNSFDTYIET